MSDHLLSLFVYMIVLLPLMGALSAGLGGILLGRIGTHRLVISCIGLSSILSMYLFSVIVLDAHPPILSPVYTWLPIGSSPIHIAFLLDKLSATLLGVVLFVSWMVHIYSIGYMAEDAGYQRFFSYMSLFTFAMLVLVLADNFLLLFFGWEGVGLVSYLLISFWFKRPLATAGGLKAFLVNRIGDIGLILGIAIIFQLVGTLNYTDLFKKAPIFSTQPLLPGGSLSIATWISGLLLIGAIGKSAQIPLHVWLPESMEGPTPISALIHAATMVTAGIYMIARLSPLFEQAPAILSGLLLIGGSTAFFMGLLAIVQHDIKRVIAYSTLSQLGYMVVALGASAYEVAIFHLMTHAFFKALLFLAAGSVIIAMHHEQDMRKMGGLAMYMPITYLTFTVGALALCAIPPFSGFYSKEMIISITGLSTLTFARYAYICVVAGALITPLYIFRVFFLTFHGKMRTIKIGHEIHESPWVVLLPLIALAIPSLVSGGWLINGLLFSSPGWLKGVIQVLPQHQLLTHLAAEYHGAILMALDATHQLTYWLAIVGVMIAWYFNLYNPIAATAIKQRFSFIYHILMHQYGFDAFNRLVWVKGTCALGRFCYQVSDLKIIEGIVVSGISKIVCWISRRGSQLQTGYLYHYALMMMVGLLSGLIYWGYKLGLRDFF